MGENERQQMGLNGVITHQFRKQVYFSPHLQEAMLVKLANKLPENRLFASLCLEM